MLLSLEPRWQPSGPKNENELYGSRLLLFKPHTTVIFKVKVTFKAMVFHKQFYPAEQIIF